MANIEFDIDGVAALSMLALTDEERTALTKDLPNIVAYISKLQEVDTSGVDAKAYLTDAVNVFRPDEVVDSEPLTREACIDAFPKKTGSALEVPGVFE